jgi:hypothetical protein
MPSVVQAIHKRGKRVKRRAELRAAKLRQTFPTLPPTKPRFPYQALEGDIRSDAARARGQYLDNLLRAKLGLDPIAEVKAGTPDGFKNRKSGARITYRKHEPRYSRS